uniref:Ribonuclease HII n=1 Tax=uncultured Flavobacteriia bacterium TaxID=212695 RepID=F4MN13_9BACT|nr:ribonuclease HII [uncultured bacterium]CBL87526.1 ribonuclease HII [uncultured Flavobacteriia bacterium]|tara:strand:- start:11557 stop:12132 length:576 start_codon:yes stop_codon:yes gene_type:complete
MLKTQFTSLLEAGVDEAGRGCLAGPVTAAVVILPKGITLPQINDSKILTEKKRYNLRSLIEKCAIDFQVAHVFQDEIDKINILNSTIKAMHLAIKKLKETPQYIIVDGNKFYPYKDVPYKCIVKGDGKYQNIAAASILAKTYRDDYMRKIEYEFPEYGWNKNKGYPTVTHRKAIEKFGITEHHRNSFKLLN